MKNVGYKLFLLGALACLSMSCAVGATAFADEEAEEQEPVYEVKIGDTEYETLSESLEHWSDGETLTLLKDVSSRIDAAGGNKTLDLNGYTLHCNTGRTLRIEKNTTLTLSDSSEGGTGKLTGGGVRVNGTLIMTGGSITENNYEDDGGGVWIDDGGYMKLSGGSVKGNCSEGNGGGICVRGSLELSGNAYVGENTKKEEPNNIYLPAGNKVILTEFGGTASVTTAAFPEVCAEGTLSGSGAIHADNPLYAVTETEGVFTIVLSPLTEITVELAEGTVIYPTTSLSDIKEKLIVSGLNKNGAEYTEFTYTVEYTEAGKLTIGNSELMVIATGQSQETVQKVISVPVIGPELSSISVQYKEQEKVYFDSELSVITAGITVTGVYSDGRERTICERAEDTSKLCGESYITDAYKLSVDFSSRTDGEAKAVVSVGALSRVVGIPISKHTVDSNEIEVVNVTVATPSDLTLTAFTPKLPSGVEPVVKLNGEPLDVSSLKAGVYQISVSFRLTDPDNYALAGSERSATLTVNFDSVTGGGENETTYVITAEGGVLPSWKFSVIDIEPTVQIDGNYDGKQAVEITLRENGYIVANPDRAISVKLLLDEKIRSKEVSVYRVLSDGTAQKIDAEREEDYVVFRADGVAQTQYVVAVENGYSVYLVCSIVFGVVCLAAAIALFWYLCNKQKIKNK